MPQQELSKDVKEVFDQLAVNGYIGDCHGELAYCYLRVSSSGQAEEGRSGLPRQIRHIHEAAQTHRLKIPWDLVFADDHTGFEFRDRPQLLRLRQEFKRHYRRAHAVVIEYIDRLSRNADWHQGFLLDEMKEHGVKVMFWKTFSSRIERAVMGAISQEGMERELQNMADGTRHKAKDGRVTAHTRAYGYIFVDSEGKESPKAKKDTYYALHPREAEVMKIIFHKLAIEGMSTRALASYLEERYPPPGRYKHWEPRQIALFVRNPLYKGEFAANRLQEVKVPAKHQRPHEPVRLVERRVTRPKDEWIIVPVPPIVPPELWALANRSLDKNAQMSRRNGGNQYLLTGLVRCAECGYSYVGDKRTKYRIDGSPRVFRSYRCSARYHRVKVVVEEISCTQLPVNADVLEHAVWDCLCRALLEPSLLLEHLDDEFAGEQHKALTEQIRFLERQIQEKDVEDDKLYRAYMADVFDAQEYAERRDQLLRQRRMLEQELDTLRKQQVTQEEIEEIRRVIVALSEQAVAIGVALDATYDIKQRMIRLLVDRIFINSNEGWIQIEGAFPSTIQLDDSIVSTPAPAAIFKTHKRNAPAP